MQTVANRYEIEAELGRGGMGVVFLARDSKLGRRVALKQLALSEVGTASDEAVRRFMREAQVMGSLLHPAVVILYDVLEEEDDLYLVMEYYPSRNLSQVVAERGALPEDEVRQIGISLASGLAAAHSKGIVHRDVKPENVLLGDEGAKLTDFGVARITEGVRQQVTKLTQSGYYVGTPGYMAPEVIRGGEALAKSDTFSLGLVLHYALSGDEPYRATDVASLLYQIVYEPLDLDALQISADLRAIIERATSKDPGERPTASELRDWLAGDDSPVAPSVAAPASSVPPSQLVSPYPADAPPPAPAPPSTPPPVAAPPSTPPPVAAPPSTPPPVAAPPSTPPPAPAAAVPAPYPGARFQYDWRPKKDNRVASLIIGLLVGAVVVFLVIGAAVVASNRVARNAGGDEGRLPRGFQWHDSQLGYRAALPGGWTTELDRAASTEFLWSPDQESGILVANLGSADPSIYSLGSEELVSMVKSDLSLGEGYAIDEGSLKAEPDASFGGARAAKVNLDITGPPNEPRYRAELFMFNKSEKMWAVMTLGRRLTYESSRPAFSQFETTFQVAS